MRTPLAVSWAGARQVGHGAFLASTADGDRQPAALVFVVGFIIKHLGSTRAAMIESLIIRSWPSFWPSPFIFDAVAHAARPPGGDRGLCAGAAAKFVAILFNNFYTTALGVAAFYAILKLSLGN